MRATYLVLLVQPTDTGLQYSLLSDTSEQSQEAARKRPSTGKGPEGPTSWTSAVRTPASSGQMERTGNS